MVKLTLVESTSEEETLSEGAKWGSYEEKYGDIEDADIEGLLERCRYLKAAYWLFNDL